VCLWGSKDIRLVTHVRMCQCVCISAFVHARATAAADGSACVYIVGVCMRSSDSIRLIMQCVCMWSSEVVKLVTHVRVCKCVCTL